MCGHSVDTVCFSGFGRLGRRHMPGCGDLHDFAHDLGAAPHTLVRCKPQWAPPLHDGAHSTVLPACRIVLQARTCLFCATQKTHMTL